MAEPILRWAGGKRQMLDEIMPRLPPKDIFGRYFEPFFGGGAVFFALEPANGIINDVNPKLMNFYEQLREQPERLLGKNKELDALMNQEDADGQKEIYYQKRNEFNSLRDDSGNCEDRLKEAVLFLFLNRTCFNGLFRTNESGEFNVPMGSKWTEITSIEQNLRIAHRVLQGTNILSGDFKEMDKYVETNDLVFFDPPYPGESKTAKFKKYDPSGFERDEQDRLLEYALELDERGVKVMITNALAAEEIYMDHETFDTRFRIVRIKGRRQINSDHTKRTNIGYTDIIASNFSPFSSQETLDKFRSDSLS